MEEDIRLIMKQVNKSMTHKKLKVIGNFLSRTFGTDISFSSAEALENYLNISSLTDDNINGIYEVLEKKFTKGFPYFLMEFSWLEKGDFTSLRNELESVFALNKPIEINPKTFLEIKRLNEISSNQNDFLSFVVEGNSYKTNYKAGAKKVKGKLIESIEFNISFDFATNLLMIQCGDKAYSNNLKNYLNSALKSISLKSISTITNTRSITFEGEQKYHEKTYVIIDILLSKLKEEQFLSSDVLAVSFTNTKKEHKVKSTKMSGNKLFTSKDVYARLIALDEIKSVKFQLISQGSSTSSIAQNSVVEILRIDFVESFKITFYEQEGTHHHREFIHRTMSAFNNAFSQPHNCSKTEKLLSELSD